MQNKSLRFRQVHLDFHTSPHIPNIGAAFDKRAWQETLIDAHVDSITCFSKCHHGFSYHPTQIGEMHPHLKFDLLRAQMDTCREIDVKVPVYISAGFDNLAAERHPEWRMIDAQGRYGGGCPSPLEAGFYRLCFNTPYLGHLCDQIREACRLFPDADGIFLDIIGAHPCCCPSCLKSMLDGGLDPERAEERQVYAEQVLKIYFQKTTAAAQEINSGMPIFHNHGHVVRGRRDQLAYQSHLELESLPTGGWGYDHFPESTSYVGCLEKDYLGMTGKFHTNWGEFGGFKHPNALRYECAAMMAFGAKCSVGDQLHPNGALDPSTYRLIGAAYAEVKAKESWCRNTIPLADIGVLSSEAVSGRKPGMSNPADTGACRVLLEGHHLFALIDAEMDFFSFKLLILPDEIVIDLALKARLEAFLHQGGKLLLSGTSGLEGHRFLFDLGAECFGENPFSPDYIVPAEGFRVSFLDSPLVMYTRSRRIKVLPGRGKSLGQVYDPYFNRSFRQFCSHQHTPNQPTPSGFDCGVINGNIAYLAHAAFTLYANFGAVAHRDYILAVIETLLGDARRVRTNLPSQARITLRAQPEEKRRIVHLLYANKHVRGRPISISSAASQNYVLEVVEELEPRRDTHLHVGNSARVRLVTLEPEGRAIGFVRQGETIEIIVDEFRCHQIVVLHEE